MLSEMERLRADENLYHLLKHYADLGALGREIWQDRLMGREGFSNGDLSRLHGELLAFAWIEQNTGVLRNPTAGTIPGCYRITAAGLRALKRAKVQDDDQEDYPSQAA